MEVARQREARSIQAIVMFSGFVSVPFTFLFWCASSEAPEHDLGLCTAIGPSDLSLVAMAAFAFGVVVRACWFFGRVRIWHLHGGAARNFRVATVAPLTDESPEPPPRPSFRPVDGVTAAV